MMLGTWFRFDNDEDQEPSHEANIYRNGNGTYRVDWCHSAVGLVSSVGFSTYRAAEEWLKSYGYQEF